MNNSDTSSRETRPDGTARLEMFSDGVFAIAITLLVLELIQFLHTQTGDGLIKSMLHHWEPFVAFIIGFTTILICWINHHHAFDYIVKTDSHFMWVNGFLLFMVTLTPFPTAVLAEFLKTEGKTALAFFGFNYFMIALAAYGICAYAYSHFLVESESRELFHCIKLTYGYSVIYTFIAFFICFVSIPLAIAMYIFMFGVFAYPKAFALRLLKKRNAKKAGH